MQYSTLIVEDETRAARVLEVLIKEFLPEIKILAHAKSVPEAVNLIHIHKPQLVFLDIEMPQYSGFDLLSFFEKGSFEIIFTTGHTGYALKAFEVSAIGYVVKPIVPHLLVEATRKAIQQINSKDMRLRLETLERNLNQKNIQRIAVATSDGTQVYEVDQIVYMKAEGAYTLLYLKDNQSVMVSKNLKDFEEIFSENEDFLRIHKSYLIRLSHVVKYQKTNMEVELKNGITIPVSREKKEFLDSYIEKLKV
jgi:two-component system LytT family response regulator